jgi:nitrogen regulatory protein PII
MTWSPAVFKKIQIIIRCSEFHRLRKMFFKDGKKSLLSLHAVNAACLQKERGQYTAEFYEYQTVWFYIRIKTASSVAVVL